ncbi:MULTISPECIES: hypothetical protein [Legionella]|nr:MULTISPECIES: hypothetical protein [Legionella]
MALTIQDVTITVITPDITMDQATVVIGQIGTALAHVVKKVVL